MKRTWMVSLVIVLFGASVLLSCSSSNSGGGDGGVTSLGSLFLFPADDGVHGVELWRSDGTGSGTGLLKDANPSFWPSFPANITKSGTNVYFVADDGTHGAELWATDGTAAGTRLVKDINPAGSSLNVRVPVGGSATIQNLTDVNGTLFFTADDGTNGQELWKSDGTEAGTMMVTDITPTAGMSSYPQYLSNANGTLYFTVNDGVINRIWKSDGTTAGTVMVNPNAPAGFFLNSPFSEVSGTVYFSAHADASGYQLWKTDGTDAGTGLVGTTTCTAPGKLTNVNGTLYFTGWDTVKGWTLCTSDGTGAGTSAIGPQAPTQYTSPESITNVNGMVFFTAEYGTNGRELWVSNGTATGTLMVKDINPADGMGSYPQNLTAVNGTLFFTADDGTHGYELWKSDGTAAGTVMVKDILTPPAAAAMKNIAQAGAVLGSGSNPRMLQNVNGTLFFLANDGYHGYEPWRSDGTAAGTWLIKDINFGTNGALNIGNVT